MSFTWSQLAHRTDAKIQQKKRLDFHDCLKPAHAISSIFGLLTFKFRTDSNGQIEGTSVDVFNALWFVTSIVLNLVLSYIVQISPRSTAELQSSSITLLSDQFIWILQLLMCLASVFLSMFNRNRFSIILRDVIAFDKNVKNQFPIYTMK